jgi:hypothetical protein
VTTIAVAGAAVAGGAVAAVELKDKIGGGGGERYTGSFSGTISGVVSGARNCTYTRTVTGATAKLGLREHSDSVVRGEFEYEGTSSVTATTCQNGVPDAPQFIGSVDELTGSPSSFTGRQVFPAPAATGPSGERITGEHVYTFQGSINGNTITGTFKYEESTQSTIGQTGERQAGVGTFSITFQKQ